MTDATAAAWDDLDSAISGVKDELSTLVTLAQQLKAQIDNGTATPDMAAEIETRAKTLQDALASTQAAVPSPSPEPTPAPTPEPTPTPAAAAEPADMEASVVNPPSPSTSTPVEDSGPAKAGGGSPMG